MKVSKIFNGCGGLFVVGSQGQLSPPLRLPCSYKGFVPSAAPGPRGAEPGDCRSLRAGVRFQGVCGREKKYKFIFTNL